MISLGVLSCSRFVSVVCGLLTVWQSTPQLGTCRHVPINTLFQHVFIIAIKILQKLKTKHKNDTTNSIALSYVHRL